MEMPSKKFCWGTTGLDEGTLITLITGTALDPSTENHRLLLGLDTLLCCQRLNTNWLWIETLPHPGFHKAAGEIKDGMTHPKVMIACMYICLYDSCHYISVSAP